MKKNECSRTDGVAELWEEIKEVEDNNCFALLLLLSLCYFILRLLVERLFADEERKRKKKCDFSRKIHSKSMFLVQKNSCAIHAKSCKLLLAGQHNNKNRHHYTTLI